MNVTSMNNRQMNAQCHDETRPCEATDRGCENDCLASCTLPIVPARRTSVSDGDRAQIARLAAQLSLEDRHLSSTAFFGTGVKSGFGTAPAILIGDKSEIPLLAPAGEDALEYRIALLARDGDIVVVSTDRNQAFETYLGNLVGLAKIEVVQAHQTVPGPPRPTARRCVESPALFKRIADHVRHGHGTSLLPHISTGSIWILAKQLHDHTNEPIFVAGPPPNLAARVNDKIWFGNIAVRLLGEMAVPPKITAFGPAALTGHVLRLARKWEKLVIKVPNSAGSAGNFPVSTGAIRNFSAKALHGYLQELLSATGSQTLYPLMVEVWDCNVQASPSVQIWIPDRKDGDPVIEGIFDQVLTGEEARFAGASPVNLPRHWDELLCRDAMKLALLFQHLGYFGRCSFDTIIAGKNENDATLHWIECNGRWGGVSLPMTFMNRLFDPGRHPAYVIVQRSDLDFPGLSFQHWLDRLDDQLYRPGGRPEGIILIAPGGLEKGTAAHMIAMDETIEKASCRADRVLEMIHSQSIE